MIKIYIARRRNKDMNTVGKHRDGANQQTYTCTLVERPQRVQLPSSRRYVDERKVTACAGASTLAHR